MISNSRYMPAGLRLTAADRPGVAQPVPERDIPAQPWRTIAASVLLLTLVLSLLWEWRMRSLELVAGDFGYSISAWAEQRQRVDAAANPGEVVVIVGDSRILFDTNLDLFQKLTGKRPIQLALPGANGRPFLEDLANDKAFRGLVIVGGSELSYFRSKAGVIGQKALSALNGQSPSQRWSFAIFSVLNRFVAMLDDDYRLTTLVRRLDRGIRSGVSGPYDIPWKIEVSTRDRETWLWPRIEHDSTLRAQAHFAWHGFAGEKISDSTIKDTQVRTAAAVEKIRARGGDVVFVRPPSAPDFRVNEESRLPKAIGWDALLAAAHVKGVHADDLADAERLTLPEGSHLNRACAAVFTDTYVRKLTEILPALKLRPDAPPQLSAKDCLGPSLRDEESMTATSDRRPTQGRSPNE